MADDTVATYLNDHLAGSVAAIDLLAHLQDVHGGHGPDRFLAALRTDIEADRQELERLMDRLGVAESRTRKAGAWLSEKVSHLQLRLDDPAAGSLHLLEAFDALATGIEGKRSLWRALAAAAEEAPSLQGPDYARLEQRAEDQRVRLETVRLEAARAALRPSV